MARGKRANKPYYRARHKTLSDLAEEDTKHNFEERFKGGGSHRPASEPVYFGVLDVDGREDSFKTVTQENYRDIAKDLKEAPQPGGGRKRRSSESESESESESSRVSDPTRSRRRRGEVRRAIRRSGAPSQIIYTPSGIPRDPLAPTFQAPSLSSNVQQHGAMHSFSQMQMPANIVGTFTQYSDAQGYDQTYPACQDYVQPSNPTSVGKWSDSLQWEGGGFGQLEVPANYYCESDPEPSNAHAFGNGQIPQQQQLPSSQNAEYPGGTPDFAYYFSPNLSVYPPTMSLAVSPASQVFPSPLLETDTSRTPFDYSVLESQWSGADLPATLYQY